MNDAGLDGRGTWRVCGRYLRLGDEHHLQDIPCIPMARGVRPRSRTDGDPCLTLSGYLAAVMDWFSRKVLAGRLPITLSADFCVEALQEALGRPGRPEVFNTDQGSQFTSIDCIKALKGEPRRPPPVQDP